MWPRGEHRRHQRVGVELALEARASDAVVPRGPDRPQRQHELAHAGRRVRPRRAEALLDVPPHLRPQPEHDAPARVLLQLVRRVGQAHRVAGEGDGDPGARAPPAPSARPPASATRRGRWSSRRPTRSRARPPRRHRPAAATLGRSAPRPVSIFIVRRPRPSRRLHPSPHRRRRRGRTLDRRRVDRERERDPDLHEAPGRGMAVVAQQVPGHHLGVVGNGGGVHAQRRGHASGPQPRQHLLRRQRPDRLRQIACADDLADVPSARRQRRPLRVRHAAHRHPPVLGLGTGGTPPPAPGGRRPPWSGTDAATAPATPRPRTGTPSPSAPARRPPSSPPRPGPDRAARARSRPPAAARCRSRWR